MLIEGAAHCAAITNFRSRHVLGITSRGRYEIGTTSSLRRWYHADERGSIIATSNESGTLHRSFTYDEYGVPGTTNSGRFQYTGQMWLGRRAYSYKARIPSPTTGRFRRPAAKAHLRFSNRTAPLGTAGER
jgi:hypothetical protein